MKDILDRVHPKLSKRYLQELEDLEESCRDWDCGRTDSLAAERRDGVRGRLSGRKLGGLNARLGLMGTRVRLRNRETRAQVKEAPVRRAEAGQLQFVLKLKYCW
ncbi:hypothetical protein HPP92_018371 [Vanilla planifolia]|uniref:Uncharacterized protein n=1 Tax=Vanilla planifolia TaxID=51239 RepID=A0A835UPF6_VANPL|nr:hypothetical protein HPP92_018371 [Vanilla planifolia]